MTMPLRRATMPGRTTRVTLSSPRMLVSSISSQSSGSPSWRSQSAGKPGVVDEDVNGSPFWRQRSKDMLDGVAVAHVADQAVRGGPVVLL